MSNNSLLNFRLAEYQGNKFERFLNLGSGKDQFVYAGDEVILGMGTCCTDDQMYFRRDLLDPLNRFNGRFNGRTYGEGRFVLIKDGEDTLSFTLKFYRDAPDPAPDDDYEGYHLMFSEGDRVMHFYRGLSHFHGNKDIGRNFNIREQKEFVPEILNELRAFFPNEDIGDGWKKSTSIHENPELFEKLK